MRTTFLDHIKVVEDYRVPGMTTYMYYLALDLTVSVRRSVGSACQV